LSAPESGKYKGKTAPQVVVIDPAWFFEELRSGRMTLPYCEARDIGYKAAHIAIPKPDPENWVIGWEIDSDDQLLDFHIVRTEDANEDDFGLITDCVNFYHLLSFDYKPEALKRLSVAFRRNYFGGAEATEEVCGSFFSKDKNFVWCACLDPWDDLDAYVEVDT
jgi:hypothetical protein